MGSPNSRAAEDHNDYHYDDDNDDDAGDSFSSLSIGFDKFWGSEVFE